MKTVCQLNQCAGCKACVHKCPKGAIYIEDSVDALNAVIDESLCIECNICHNVCPENNPPEYIEPKYWLQGWIKSEKLRHASSSGGAAAALSRAFIRSGGVVCSCLYQKGEFIFAYAGDIDDAAKFVGSKYVKSNPDAVYEKSLTILSSGINLMFIGLPCQIAGIKNYLGDKFKNQVYYVELICHGSPSSKVLDSFLASNQTSLTNIQSISFREKSNFYVYTDDKKYKKCVPNGMRDLYSFTFLTGTTYTENCYACRYARTERIADITLGDSWGSNLSSAEKSKGISLIICQTDRAYDLVRKADMHIEYVDREQSIAANKQLKSPSPIPSKRAFFFRTLKKIGFNAAVRKAYPLKYVKYITKRFFNRLCG